MVTLADVLRSPSVDPRTGQTKFDPALFRQETPQIRSAPQLGLHLLADAVRAYGRHKLSRQAERERGEALSDVLRAGNVAGRETVPEFRNPDDPSQVLVPERTGREAAMATLLKNKTLAPHAASGMMAQILKGPGYDEREKPVAGGMIQKEISRDGGRTWQPMGDPYPRFKPEGRKYKEREIPLPGNMVQKQVSQDGGRTWQPIGPAYNRFKSSAGEVTAAQQANNAEIAAARRRLRAIDIPPGSTLRDEIMKRTRSADQIGFDNPDYDPMLERDFRTATQRKVGSDPEFEQLWSTLDVRTPEPPAPPAPASPPESSGVMDHLGGVLSRMNRDLQQSTPSVRSTVPEGQPGSLGSPLRVPQSKAQLRAGNAYSVLNPRTGQLEIRVWNGQAFVK